jgi:hypothetical protein
MYPDIANSYEDIKKLSLLTLHLIRDKNYKEYLEENGYDELLTTDEEGFTPIEYMFLASNMDTITYIFDNAPFDILRKLNMETTFDCICANIPYGQKIPANSIIIQKINFLLKRIMNYDNYLDFCKSMTKIVIDMLINVVNKLDEENNTEVIKNIHDIFLNLNLENRIHVLDVELELDEVLINKLLDTFITHDEQKMLYEKIILERHGNIYSLSLELNKLLKEFTSMCYSSEIIASYKYSPLNKWIYIFYCKAIVNQGFYVDIMVSDLEFLLKIFGKDFIFTEVDVSDDILEKDKRQMMKPKVIDCIVKVMNYLIDQNHPDIYEKHKEILSDILNIDDYM